MKAILTMLGMAAIMLCISCQQSKKSIPEVTETTYKEMPEEWTSLSSGNVVTGWHGYNRDTVPSGWQINDGILSFNKDRGGRGDIVTDEEYENFEFALEWKISDCGNSGIFFNIVESPEYPSPWLTGPEMQVLDDKCHPDAKFVNHRAGCLYDMIETTEVTVKPAGEWNAISIRSLDGNVTFTQNGVEVVSFTMHDEGWTEMIANSKFKTMNDFGLARKGRLGLQDHDDDVWFRNIRIRTL